MEYYQIIYVAKNTLIVMFVVISILTFILDVNYPDFNKPIQQEEDIKPVKATKAELSEVRFAGKTGVALRGGNKGVKQGRVKVKISEIALVDAVMIRSVDGDTCWFDCNGRKIDVRFFGIDCPESNCYHKKQKFGDEAKAYTSKLLNHGDKVQLRIVGSGNHDREAAIIFKNGININEKLVKDGYAWVDSNYAKRDPEWNNKLIALQEDAKAKKLGLWIDKNPVAPWIFRAKIREDFSRRKAA